MPKIINVESEIPPIQITQEKAVGFAKSLFSSSFKDIDRLLPIFTHSDITTRYFVKDIDWFSKEHSFEEKNNLFIENSVELGKNCIEKIIQQTEGLNYGDIDAIITICTSGIATPTIEARIMNLLPFSPYVKRIPIWGLGCAGGAAGLARAQDYCVAYPKANVLVLTIELCSLTFQVNDRSKSNLVGTALFADGVACALVSGDKSAVLVHQNRVLPSIIGTQSILKKDSLDVMGWDIRNEGMFVVFSKNIPSLVQSWLRPNVDHFLQQYEITLNDVSNFVVHPGGKKVLDAYKVSLNVTDEQLFLARKVLKDFGNMSSATVLYVLKEHFKKSIQNGEYGLALALGPGFASELLLMRWE
ncbi:3-oxoacyl-[acyl-carrier-protein] synthase III C-terminal domain-containing protein [Bacillus spongiae]|uniref:3-oxoacyl-[acyl-carrier-protein] synthase III C-terminal domain-containing protein n=1 Tax=Bacillus spongiae TaxID=2683610 RepID=A0ABU8HD37_9BACI